MCRNGSHRRFPRPMAAPRRVRRCSGAGAPFSVGVCCLPPGRASRCGLTTHSSRRLRRGLTQALGLFVSVTSARTRRTFASRLRLLRRSCALPALRDITRMQVASPGSFSREPRSRPAWSLAVELRRGAGITFVTRPGLQAAQSRNSVGPNHAFKPTAGVGARRKPCLRGRRRLNLGVRPVCLGHFVAHASSVRFSTSAAAPVVRVARASRHHARTGRVAGIVPRE